MNIHHLTNTGVNNCVDIRTLHEVSSGPNVFSFYSQTTHKLAKSHPSLLTLTERFLAVHF